jgi:apolipoprotein N-acyltransferase
MFRKWLPADPARCALAILAGVMLAISFPHWGVAGFAWIAPGLILASAMGTRGKEAFRLGVIAGLANWLVSIYWLLLIPVKFAPIVGWLLLCAFLSLYTGLWVWLAAKSYPLQVGRGVSAEPLALRDAPRWFYGSSAFQRLIWCFSCAAFWTAIEMIQGRFLSGFPWNLLGTSQYKMLHLIQFSAYTGVYGVSFLVVWFSVSLTCASIALLQNPANRWATFREILLPALAAAWAVMSGSWFLAEARYKQPVIKVALVQPSIPQTAIWDPAENAFRFQQLLKLSELALAEKPDILVWPEAAVPSQFRWDTNRYDGLTVRESIIRLAQQHQVWLIFGADDAEPSGDKVNFYNSAFAVSPEGKLSAAYRKRQLVMFGEYVPLSRVLPFLKDFTQVYGEFTPGTAPIPFKLDSLGVTTTVLICFEDLFPHLAREYVSLDTDFLLNLTNNGWFGESAAHWQHAVGAVFRAVENGLPLVRCANNGLSCWIDPQGALHEVFFSGGSKDIYRAGYKIAHIPVLKGQKRSLTFYTRHGDVFGWACVAFTAAFPLARFVMLLTRKRHP